MTEPMSVEEFTHPSWMTLENFVEFRKEYLGRETPTHTREWIQLIIDNRYVLILAPREHTKSTTIRDLLLWFICNDHNLRVLIASHKEELADEFSLDILQQLERDDLQQDFNFTPGKPWRPGQAFLQRANYPAQGKRGSTATLGTVAKKAGVTGKRFDIVVMDDILTVDVVETEKQRRRLERWINKEVFPALDSLPSSKWIVIGTRKHIEDWYAKLLEMPHWVCRKYQLYTVAEDGTKTYLWPERFNEAVEAEKRAQMEPDEFAMEFMNEPIAAQGLRFRWEWIAPFFFKSWQNEVPERHREFYMGIDPNVGSKTDRSSYMGLVVVCFDKRPSKQDIYVVDIVRSKLSLAEQTEIIAAKIEEWKPQAAMIEAGLINKMFSEQLIRTMPILQPVVYRAQGASTNLRGTSDISKIGRIENIVGWLFKKGKIHLADPSINPSSKMFIEEEYLQFPEGKLDCMDALNMACDRIDVRAVLTQLKIWKF